MSALAFCGVAGVVCGIDLGGTGNLLRWFRQGFTSTRLQHHVGENIGDQRMDCVEIAKCVGMICDESKPEVMCAE
jgi:hypothetical protein